MISIFNGKKRSLGDSDKEIFVRLNVEFRGFLHHFKGSMLAVFLCIALHSDENGWAYPSYHLIQKETGYGRDTIADALRKLCELEINGKRVLLKLKVKNEHKFFNNHYLIFPTEDEIENYADKVESGFPCSESTDTGKPNLKNNHTSKNNHLKNKDTLSWKNRLAQERAYTNISLNKNSFNKPTNVPQASAKQADDILKCYPAEIDGSIPVREMIINLLDEVGYFRLKTAVLEYREKVEEQAIDAKFIITARRFFGHERWREYDSFKPILDEAEYQEALETYWYLFYDEEYGYNESFDLRLRDYETRKGIKREKPTEKQVIASIIDQTETDPIAPFET